MLFRVLGPLRVLIEGDERPLGGPKQRLVLALLISAEGRAVSTGTLIEGLWGDDVPASAKKMLQGYVHHLRGQVGDVLRTESGGYSLHAADDVDAVEFAGLHDQASALAASDPRRAAALLGQALALWDGPAYADLQHELALVPEITRLENLRLAVLGDRIDADLACGAGPALVGELEALTVEYPLHERFRSQHLVALYRAGRQVEALRAYERYRRHLAAETGLEPSADLKQLEQQILARDDGLLLGGVDESVGLRAVRGYELRELVSSSPSGEVHRAYQRSVGRQVAVRVLGPETADRPDFVADHLAATQRLAALDHPHVCLIFDAWREPGSAYQVSRWLGGGSLRDRLGRGDELSATTSLRILEQIGGALADAHENGVVHGRVDTSSVLFDDADNAYLSGFVAGLEIPGASEANDRADFAVLAHHLLAGGPPCRERCGRPTPAATVPRGSESVFEIAFSPEGYERIDDLLRSLRRSLGLDAVAPTGPQTSARTDRRNPYKSLRAFQEGDAGDFYGREALLDGLCRSLEEHRLVAVVGPSGCGKSSLVKAGLLPRLRHRTGPPCLTTEMYPGPFPFEELEAALLRVGVRRSSVIEELTGDERGLARALGHILPEGETEVVLVIDQFEELFSMVPEEGVRRLFLDSLASALSHPRSRLRVVLSMRADFFDRPLQYPRFGELLQAGLVPLSALDTDQLSRAIVEPARSVGVDFEPGLAAQIVDDVAGQAGALPLLQYALTELFDQREADQLTLASYRRSGGVVGALGRRAEELYQGLTPPGRHAARHALLRMVAVDEATDDVRRRVRRSELASLDVAESALDEALQAFGSYRLLTFDLDPTTRGPTVEVAHEAMLREWSRLADWVEQLRDDLVLRRRLETAMGEWHGAGEDPAYLLSGGRLAQFDAWADTTELALGTRERAFLELGRERDAALARRAAVRRRRVMAALTGAALVAVAFGAIALVQRGQAADEAFVAETARLGSQAGVVVESNRELALLMAVEAHRRDPGFAGLDALQRVLVDAGPFLGVVGGPHTYSDVRWVTDDRLLAVTGAELHSLDVAESSSIVLPVVSPSILATSPAGLAAVADGRGDVWLVDVMRGLVDGFVPGRGSTAAAISPDGATLALGYPDGSIRSFDVASGREAASAERAPDDDDEGIELVAFDALGDRLVSVRGEHLRAWKAADLSPLGPEFAHRSGPDDLNLSPRPPRHVWFDGPDAMVVAVDDAHVVRWQAVTGERASLGTVPTGLTDAGRSSFGIADAVSGGRGEVLVLTDDGRVLGLTIDELARGRATSPATPGFVFDTQRADTPALSIDPSGAAVAVASDQGIVFAALDGRGLLADAHPIGASVLPTINRAGTAVAAGLASDGILDLTEDPAVPRPFDVGVEIAAFAGSPPTYQFTTAGERDLLLWTSGPELVAFANAYDYGTGEYVGEFRGAFVPAWSDDGTSVAAAGAGNGSRVEDLTTGTTLFEHPARIRAADFDSTGRRVVMSFVDETADGRTVPADEGLIVDLVEGTAEKLPPVQGGTFSVAFTAGDDEVVLVGGDGAIWALDPDDHDRRRELQDADESTELLAAPPTFSNDGEWMFSSADGAARVWHVPSGRQLGQPFPSQPGGVPYAVADDDVLRMVTALGGNALVWNLDVDTWAGLACRAVGRSMTETEWELFGPTDTDHRASCKDTGPIGEGGPP